MPGCFRLKRCCNSGAIFDAWALPGADGLPEAWALAVFAMLPAPTNPSASSNTVAKIHKRMFPFTFQGLFCEPSSAAGLVAVLRGDVEGDRLVVTITGHGLKDPAAADRLAPPPTLVAPDPDSIEAAGGAGRRRQQRTP